MTIAVGSSALLSYSANGLNGSPQFVSRNTNVATVSANGTVQGVAIGSTWIVAELAGMRDSARVNVVEPGAPGTMTLLGTGLVPERWTSEVAAFGNYAYTGTWYFRPQSGDPPILLAGDVLKIWNITANTPVLVDSIVYPQAATVSDVQISEDGKLLAVSLEQGASENRGLFLYDLADPDDPVQVGHFITPYNIHTVKLGRVNNRHYAVLSAQANSRLIIVDITNPAAPQEVHNTQPGGAIHDTFVRDGYLFAAQWEAGLHIYDIGGGGRGGTPANPVRISSIVTSLCSICGGFANVHNVWWFHNPNTGERRYAFVGEEGPGDVGSLISRGALHVVDVSDLSNPREVAIYEPDPLSTVNEQPAGAHNFVMDEENEILYAAFYNGGVRALDVSGDLSSCTDQQKTRGLCDLLKMGREVAVAANTHAPKFVWGVARVGSTLLASDMHVGIHKIDISGLQR